MQNRIQKLLILSGPSGSGKSTLCAALQEAFPNLYFSISTTTRNPRAGEKHGREYYFSSVSAFEQDIQEKKFLEYTYIHHHYYGTSKEPVQRALDENRLVVFDVDVEGHKNIKIHYPHAKSVFITTSTDALLKKRLENRKTDTEKMITARLQHAYEEMKHMDEFDYLIINDDLEKSKKRILHIVESLECAAFDSEELCKTWKKLEKSKDFLV